MKTNVFKKAGYFAAAFALAASGSIFVPTVAYAEGDTSNVITRATVDAADDLLIPINEAVCRGEVNSFVLGEDIDVEDGMIISSPEDWLGLCTYMGYIEGLGEDEVAIDGVFTIDLNGHTISSNTELATVIFDAGIDLTIVGDGQVVNNGAGPVFSGDGTLTIKGGTYNKEISAEYLAEGYAEYKVSDDEYVVDKDVNITEEIGGNAIYVRVGETIDLADGLSETAKKYIEFIHNDADFAEFATMDGTKLTGLKSADLDFDATLNKVSGGAGFTSFPVVVYSEEDDESGDVYVNISTDNMAREDMASSYADGIAALEAVIGDDNIAGYYDISAQLLADNGAWVVVYNLGELSEAKTVTLTIPSEVPAVADGYTRNYYVFYYHNGEVKKITDVTDNGDGTVSFESKEFSPYILAYSDTAVAVVDDDTATGPVTPTEAESDDTDTVADVDTTINTGTLIETVTSEEAVLISADTTDTEEATTTTNPKTWDNGLSYIVLASVAAVTMAGAAIYLTRREA